MTKTIAAISTALGIGAVSVIKVSGDDAINIVNKIFKGKNLLQVETHTINYGYIINEEEIVDEVLISVMKAPKTYTKEDIVEINCHGGIITTNKVLELLLENGCELAEPGEFTKRAFLNGRIDLLEAEGIMNLINAKTEINRKLSINQLKGSVSNNINELRKEVLKTIARIEVNIDYPEYEDVEKIEQETLLIETKEIQRKLEKIYKESESGKIIQEGINTAIIGKPNVGKSSLLNALLEEEKAIVTEIEGTTRDAIEAKLNIGGLILNIIDTAGIRDTEDIVEKIGVNKSLELIEKSELIIFVLSNDEKITDQEKTLLEKIKKKNHVVVINKIDLSSKINKEEIKNLDIVEISTYDFKTIENLKNKIKSIFDLELIEKSDLTYLTSARSISLIKKSIQLTKEIEHSIKNNMPIDIIEIDLKTIWKNLGLITGEVYADELTDQLFSDFCLGK